MPKNHEYSHEHNWLQYAEVQYWEFDVEVCLICHAARHKPIGRPEDEWIDGLPEITH